MDYGIFRVDELWEALAMVPLGAAVLLLGIPALSALGRLYTTYAELLLGSNADPALTAQVSDLRDARSRIIEAADAERRRIERDLHDGAQQRLVALALTLRTAEKRAADGQPGATELVRQAGDEAGLALKELRDLARGIHPAILTNRGLPAALDDLAGRALVPTEVLVAPEERLPAQVEAAAYFVVSECLANIDKHAQATAATVAVTPQDGQLLVTVTDDGIGGAQLGGGSGLQGLEDRVGALDGSLSVESAPGGGTQVRAGIPLVDPVEGPCPASSGRPLLSDDEAAELQLRRRHGLRVRAWLLGGIALLLRGDLGAHRRAQRVARVAAAGAGADRRAGRLEGARQPARAPVRARRRARRAGPAAAPRPAVERGQAGDPQPVPDRHLAGRRRRLLLARLGDARVGDRARPEGGPVVARLDRAPPGHALGAQPR